MQLENVADIYPLSPVQQGMLFHALSAPKSGVYIEQYACKLRGDLRLPEFQAAWQQVIDRQPVLRTAFLWEGLDDPLQIVREKVEAGWELEDWRANTPAEQEAKLAEFLTRDRTTGFDLRQAPITRFRLMRLQDETYQFVWSFHHLLADGWSIPIIWQEVLTCYTANCQQKPPSLPPFRPYRDYIAWLQNQDANQAKAFWQSQLQDFTESTPLPAARTESDRSTQPYRQHAHELPAPLHTALQTFARQHQLTLNTVIQGAWALLLHHYSSQDDVTYGSVVSGRPTELKDVEGMVGMFINTLPVRVAIAPDTPLIPWLQARQQQLLNIRAYESTPLTDIQRWSDVPPGSPLFESIVVFENYPAAAPPDLTFTIQDIRYLEQSNYPLALLVVPKDTLELLFLYDPARFEDKAIAHLHAHLEMLLIAFIEQPHITLAHVPRLSPLDQQQLAPQQPVDYPHDATIHQLIEAQVERTPNAPAVIYQAATLTYRELNDQANQLAQVLRSQGVISGDRVAICLPPSLDRIITILATLKTNAAYVPLDPTYPPTRLDYCLRDTNPRILLTQRSISLPDTGVARIDLDNTEWRHRDPVTPISTPNSSTPPRLRASAPPLPPAPQNLAYIIYTSGSTGQPKGVMVSHRNLVHSTTARSRVYPDPVGRFLLLSSIAFDSSVAGIFWTLCQGGTLVLPPNRIEQDLQQLATLIAEQQITHTLCVPTLYALLLDTVDPQQLQSLNTVIVAGEACPRTLAQTHHAQHPNTHLYNEYGPTEATIWATAYRIPPQLPPGPIPIGHPIPNTQVHLLNQNHQPVPIGAIAELYISGDGVSQGYLNQPAKTAVAFGKIQNSKFKIQNSLPSLHHSKALWAGSVNTPPRPHAPTLYKTGDLARYRFDGTLEWLGRSDRQVKIRGYRIELGEIEDALRSQSAVQEAVVVARSSEPTTDDVASLVAMLAALEPDKADSLLAAIEEGG